MTSRPPGGRVVALAVALGLLAGSGCAQRTDWVEGTLVTVDVTGVWTGRATPSVSGASVGVQGEMEMTLTQRGAKVNGEGRIRTQKFSVEGTVRGDVLSFTDTGGRLRAVATVTGDEMAGEGRSSIGSSGSGQQPPFRFTLAR